MFIRQLEYLAALDRERHFGRAAAACHVVPADAVGRHPQARARARRAARAPRARVRGADARGRADPRLGAARARRPRGLQAGGQRACAAGSRARCGSARSRRRCRCSPRVTARFRERHPRMRVRLISMNSRQIAHGLEHGELDAGLTYLDNEPLAHVDAVAAVARALPARRPPADGELGRARPCRGRRPPSCRSACSRPDMQHRRIVDGAFAAAGATPQPGGGDQLGLDARSPTPAPACPASPPTPGSTPTRCPTTCARSRSSSPEIEHTIGLVTATTIDRTPVIAELLDLSRGSRSARHVASEGVQRVQD